MADLEVPSCHSMIQWKLYGGCSAALPKAQFTCHWLKPFPSQKNRHALSFHHMTPIIGDTFNHLSFHLQGEVHTCMQKAIISRSRLNKRTHHPDILYSLVQGVFFFWKAIPYITPCPNLQSEMAWSSKTIFTILGGNQTKLEMISWASHTQTHKQYFLLCGVYNILQQLHLLSNDITTKTLDPWRNEATTGVIQSVMPSYTEPPMVVMLSPLTSVPSTEITTKYLQTCVNQL